MSKCNFTISFTAPAGSVLDKAKSAIEGQGGTFNGDVNAGSFSVQLMGTIAGTYEITGQEMQVSINEKPIFIGCGQIESFMRAQLGKGG